MENPQSQPQKRVYIANLGGHDLTDAKRYGQLITLTEGAINPKGIDRLLFEMGKTLSSSSAEDFLALMGHPVVNVIAAMIILTKHGRVNLLIWDAAKKTYNPRSMSGTQIEDYIHGNSTDASKDRGEEVCEV